MRFAGGSETESAEYSHTMIIIKCYTKETQNISISPVTKCSVSLELMTIAFQCGERINSQDLKPQLHKTLAPIISLAKHFPEIKQVGN